MRYYLVNILNQFVGRVRGKQYVVIICWWLDNFKDANIFTEFVSILNHLLGLELKLGSYYGTIFVQFSTTQNSGQLIRDISGIYCYGFQSDACFRSNAGIQSR